MSRTAAKLSEVSTLKTGKLNSNAAVTGGAYPFFTCSKETFQIDKFAFDTEAVLLAGNNANGIFPLKYYKGQFNAYQRTYVIETNDSGVLSTRYLYFALHPALKHFESASIGVATQYLTKGILDNFIIQLPEISEQKRIASVLSAYDDLIENNRRRIVLLEEAARLLYREWFVHFRFPGHEHVKIIDGVPEGWNLVTFADLAEYLNGFAFKPYHLGETGLPIVKIPELRGGILPKTPRYDGLEVPDKYCIETGDLVFSWSGTLVVDFWTDGSAYLNQHLFKVTPISTASVAFLLIAIRDAMPRFLNQAVGATMKHIRRSALSDVRLLMPSKDILDDFQDVVDANYSQIRTLRQTNFKLTEARDLLLPRLMDGRLEV